jgi:hypothetical protein
MTYILFTVLFCCILFLAGWVYFLQETVRGMSRTFWELLERLKNRPRG